MKLFVSDLFIIAVVLITVCNSTTSVDYNQYCPEGYNRIGDSICILITSNSSSYANECLKSGSTPTADYAKLIKGHSQVIHDYLIAGKIGEVWLPIKKCANYFLFWDLPGPMKQNGRIIELSFSSVPTEYANGDCIVYDTNVKQMRWRDCSETYQHMCLINSRDTFIVPIGLNDSKFIGRLSKFHQSYFTINDYGIGNPVNIDSNDMFVIVDQLIEQLNMQDEAILVYDPLSLSPNSSAFMRRRIITVNKDRVTKQVVKTRRGVTRPPLIDIQFNTTSNQLTVIVTNYGSLWNPKNSKAPFWCHHELNIVENPEIIPRYKMIYSTKTSRGFGTYLSENDTGIATIWCEGQLLKTFKTIQSNRLIVERNMKANNFVLCAKLKQICIPRPCQIVSELFKFNSSQRKLMNNNFTKFEVKVIHIKKILSVSHNSITLLLHFVMYFSDAGSMNKIDTFKSDFMKKFADDFNISDIRLNNICESINDYFPSAILNEKVLAKIQCYNSDGFLPSQECVGNLIEGANWKEIININIFSECSPAFSNTASIKLFNVTKQLEYFQNHIGTEGDQTPTVDGIAELVAEAIERMNTTLSNAENIKDTRLVGETLHNLAEITQTNIFDPKLDGINEEGKASLPGSTLVNSITNMIDKILEFENESLISDGNTMLDTIDKVVKQFAISNASESKEVLDDDGVRILRTNNLILVFVNPLVKNITGIELHRKISKVKDFNDFIIKTLNVNHRIEDTNTETLEVMAHITREAFDKIKIIKDNDLVAPNRLIFKFYYKPSLFEEKINDSVYIIPDGKVIGISIPNFPLRKYPEGIVTMFKPFSEPTGENDLRSCSENAVKSSPMKGWAINSWRKFETKNIVQCHARHPGNFGFVKLVGFHQRDAENITPLLTIVDNLLYYATFIGCNLSILGLALIFVTAIFNPAWKKAEASPLLLNVSAASLFLIVMYYVVEIFGKPEYEGYCPIFGCLVHYAVLVGFFVSVIVTNCQYHRYIVIFGKSVPEYLNLQIYLFGWVTPSLIVALCFGFASESYVTHVLVNQTIAKGIVTPEEILICLPTKIPLYIGLHLPIIVIICYNFSIYVWIIRRVRRETPNLRKTPSKTSVYVQIRLFLGLFFILSITWIFALLHHYTGMEMFAMIFNVSGTMQGFCLAIFSLFFDLETRNFWVQMLKCSRKE